MAMDDYHTQTMQSHSDRLNALERRQDAHEALCGERYKQIISSTEGVSHEIRTLHAALQKRIDWLLGALVILAFTMAVGPDIAVRIFGIVK